MAMNSVQSRRLQIFNPADLDRIEQLKRLPKSMRTAMKAVSAVFPFRVNNYVVEDLIDWSNIPADPIFQLTFPQEGMLEADDLERMSSLVSAGTSNIELVTAAREIQLRLNPHPAGQVDLNVPRLEGDRLPGVQHKYRETVLFFPSAGQTCFAYCTYCFRWPQFVGIDELKFASSKTNKLIEYLKVHKEVKSVLITGGDPLIMRSNLLRRYIEPLLDPSLEHITSIRIGTKALAYWPYRFTSDDDADDLLKLFGEVRAAGRDLALMAHYSHPRFLQTAIGLEGLQRVQSAGATVRCQSPVIRHINDSSDVWQELWQTEVKHGAIPYYMFVERDTGARQYFEVPLARCLEIYESAYRQVSGLARTVRGPSMSCTPGKVMVDGIVEMGGKKLFVLKFLQARDPSWVNQIFFAEFDPDAVWFDDLKPAFGMPQFFFEEAMKKIKETGFAQVWTAERTGTQPAVIDYRVSKTA